MDLVEYFAIGSMMNPISLSMRGLHPIESRPGVLKGYELIFVMAHGMAAARKCNEEKTEKRNEIHGVLHRIAKKEMETLDKSESTYVIGNKVRIELYDDDEIDTGSSYPKKESSSMDSGGCTGLKKTNTRRALEAVVYVLNEQIVNKDPDRFAIYPPTQRYIDILKGGALHYGLHVGILWINFILLLRQILNKMIL